MTGNLVDGDNIKTTGISMKRPGGDDTKETGTNDNNGHNGAAQAQAGMIRSSLDV